MVETRFDSSLRAAHTAVHLFPTQPTPSCRRQASEHAGTTHARGDGDPALISPAATREMALIPRGATIPAVPLEDHAAPGLMNFIIYAVRIIQKPPSRQR
jgi:hypothetical protein